MSLPYEKSSFAALSLQWCHMSVMASQISDCLTICSISCPGWDQKKHRNSLIRDVIISNIEIVLYSIVIAVTQLQLHDASNPQPLDCCSTVRPGFWQRRHPQSHWRRNHLQYWNGVVITVMPHERHRVSYHQSLDCLLNSMAWLIAK